MMRDLDWDSKTTKRELQDMLVELGEHYCFSSGQTAGMHVVFDETADKGSCEIRVEGDRATIVYSTPAQAARGIGALLAGLVSENSPYTETTPFETFGIMLDCSRNAVMKVSHVQAWLRQLCLLGYNMVMLYTEDTYQLPDEPFFGEGRGAYSADELRAIIEYAAKLNIEIVPCIQTLGHLEKILRHAAYREVKDTESVLLVGEEKTYTLIEKMVSFWKEVSLSGRIHIGMDETHDLGRGRYLDLNGYRSGFDLFNEHLARVVDICDRHGLDPMIWSDMYFRLGCASGTYYDPATVIPDEVVRKIPSGVDLVYWDYYHGDKGFYLDWIERHRAMGREPIVGSGIWTWNRYWYDHRTTVANAGPCIDACREARIKELFFTMWGDNGAYCDHDSAFAGMAYCADRAYGRHEDGDQALQRRFAAICGGNYDAHIRAADIHAGAVEGFHPSMWDDPFFERRWRRFNDDDTSDMMKNVAAFEELAVELHPHGSEKTPGDMRLAVATARAFANRYALISSLLEAYRNADSKALSQAAEGIAKTRESVHAMSTAFRCMWLNHNKREGLEFIQARFGMLDARYEEMARCVREYLDGSLDRIIEWD